MAAFPRKQVLTYALIVMSILFIPKMLQYFGLIYSGPPMLGGVAAVLAALHFWLIKKGMAHKALTEGVESRLETEKIKREIRINIFTFLTTLFIALACYAYWVTNMINR